MEPEEQAFYRAVEDHCAALCRAPYLILPKDFALLRTWYRQGAPLAAILAGLDEVYERCQEEGEEPVFPLSYCRRAVNRYVRNLAAARVGSEAPAQVEVDVPAALDRLVAEVSEAATRWAASPRVAKVLQDLVTALASVPGTAPVGAVEESLSRLEVGALDSLLGALAEQERAGLEGEATAAAVGVDPASEVGRRTRRAVLLRGVRELVGLPRLEVSTDAA
jgi:hypothetical protein